MLLNAIFMYIFTFSGNFCFCFSLWLKPRNPLHTCTYCDIDIMFSIPSLQIHTYHCIEVSKNIPFSCVQRLPPI